MCARGRDRRCVDERAQRDVNECAIAHHRVQQRAATLAVGVMAVFITINQQLGCAVSDGQFAAQFEIGPPDEVAASLTRQPVPCDTCALSAPGHHD